MDNIGLYLHIPFCKTKCPYCDFYSMRGDDSDRDMYVIALIESMEQWAEKLGRKADTLYLGGGTPSAGPLHPSGKQEKDYTGRR